jgi:hypothetical protein
MNATLAEPNRRDLDTQKAPAQRTDAFKDAPDRSAYGQVFLPQTAMQIAGFEQV